MELGAVNRFDGGEVGDSRRPRYNIAPTQQVIVVRPSPNADSTSGEREAVSVRWGLLPPWAQAERISYSMMNARAETLLERKSFPVPLKHQRCIVLADGFYEWKKLGTKTKGKEDKQPYFIHMKDDRVFAFAGLWERNTQLENRAKPGFPLESCTIITTSPNALMANLHDRMPAILSKDSVERWLDPEIREPEQVLPLLSPYPFTEMEAYPVAPVVNSAKHDGAGCLMRVEG